MSKVCPDCRLSTCKHHEFRLTGEELVTTLSSSVTPCFDLNEVIYHIKPYEWTREECAHYVRRLTERGFTIHDEDLFFADMFKASVAFWKDGYTQADAQRQCDDMPKEDYPWAEEDMPAEVRNAPPIIHDTNHVVGCTCFICYTPEEGDEDISDDSLPF